MKKNLTLLAKKVEINYVKKRFALKLFIVLQVIVFLGYCNSFSFNYEFDIINYLLKIITFIPILGHVLSINKEYKEIDSFNKKNEKDLIFKDEEYIYFMYNNELTKLKINTITNMYIQKNIKLVIDTLNEYGYANSYELYIDNESVNNIIIMGLDINVIVKKSKYF